MTESLIIFYYSGMNTKNLFTTQVNVSDFN